MSDKLSSVRAKIERAKKHIDELDAALKSFRATTPYKVAAQHDAVTRKFVYYVESAAEVSIDIRLIAGEVLNNLRSALDHLVMQLWLCANGRLPSDKEVKQLCFPIFASSAKYVAGSQGKIQGLRQNAIDAIGKVEPYKGGNADALWVLHELNNIDKHRLLVFVGAAFRWLDIVPTFAQKFPNFPGIEALAGMRLNVAPADRLCPLKAGDQLFIDSTDAKFNDKLEFTFDISLHEVGVAEDKPILPFLHQMVDLVNNVVGTLAPLV